MIHFNYFIKKGQNYSPAGIIRAWAQETGQKLVHTKYFNTFVDIAGNLYEFNHLTQEPAGELEKITVYLALKYRAE